jgi:hypothetical protein
MYCTVQDMVALLPEPITVGDTNIGTPSPGRPNPSNRSKLTPDQATRYIRFAGEEVDSRLRPYYVCPLRRVKTYETEILQTALTGSNVEIKVNDTGAFSKGQMVRLQSRSEMEVDEVSEVKNRTTLVISQVTYTYSVDDGKISVLEFPDPIPLITARLAVSYCFDQLFAAEQSPNVSEYGKEQRRLAINSLDGVLSGAILLFGQDHTGKRFVRGSLFDAYQNPTPEFQFGREKQ